MKLSELAYQVVKTTLKLGNRDFLYESFKHKEFDNDIDYSADITNCFTEINQAIHRLSDLRKIPYKIEPFTLNGKSSFFDFRDTDFKIKFITAIVRLNERTGNYQNIEFRNMSATKVNLMGLSSDDKTLYVEYQEDIPHFSEDDYDYSDEENEKDINLLDYGINDSMCSDLIRYASARLFAKVDPSIAKNDELLAEQYFQDLPTHGTAFAQKSIKIKYRIGD